MTAELQQDDAAGAADRHGSVGLAAASGGRGWLGVPGGEGAAGRGPERRGARAGLRGCGAAGRGAGGGCGGRWGWLGGGEGGAPGRGLRSSQGSDPGRAEVGGSRYFGEPAIKGRTWGGVHQGSLGGALLGPDLGEKLPKRAA